MPWTVSGCLAWLLYLPARPSMICMRASDLPAATPHTALQHPISLSSIRPSTCGSVERSEVPRCPPNGPTIDGKDGVAGSIPAEAPFRACASRARSGARQARAVMISGLSHPAIIGRSRACPGIVHPGTPVGPGLGAAAHPPGRPPAGLPPAPHPRPSHLRQAHPAAGLRVWLPQDRRPHLLGDHPATPTRRVDQHRGGRTTPLGGAGRL